MPRHEAMRAAVMISRAARWSLADVMMLEMDDLEEWCRVIEGVNKK